MKNDDADPLSTKTGKRAKKKAASASPAVKTVNFRWAFTLLGWTFLISMLLSFLSSNALEHIGYFLAFLLLVSFILLGVLFDIIGIATTCATEKPFHSMAARKVDGAQEALMLIRNAEKVSSFCNDVVGDIAGIISGTTSAVIVTRISQDMSLDSILLQFLISGLVAGLTVGGKAVGKSLAINFDTKIVFFAGRVLHFLKKLRIKIRTDR